MTTEVPLFLQGGTYPARLDRQTIAAQWDEGVRSGMKVVQRAAGANFTVDIGVGSCVVDGDDQSNQGSYLGIVTVTENLSGFVAATSTQRIDLVAARINDPNAGGPAGNTMTIIRVAGTESATPVAPALPTSAIPLAQVGPFTPSSTSVTNSMIVDARILSGDRSTPGTLKWTASSRSINGWLACSSQAVSRTTYARLFDFIGSLYGNGDASTTFNVPDFRGRFPVTDQTNGASAVTGNTRVTVNAGTNGGEATHTLITTEMPLHGHVGTTNTSGVHSHSGTTSSVGDHTHLETTDNGALNPAYQSVYPSGTGGPATGVTGAAGGHSHSLSTSTDPGHTHTLTTGNTGSGAAHNVTPPYLAVYCFIRT